MDIVSRNNGMFVLNEQALTIDARTPAVTNALYAAIYDEFLGATTNPKYQNLTTLERFNKLNEFARDWLSVRGFLNVKDSAE